MPDTTEPQTAEDVRRTLIKTAVRMAMREVFEAHRTEIVTRATALLRAKGIKVDPKDGELL